jgi:carboxymethylenebutenolidase
MGGGFALLTVHTMAAVSANYGFPSKNLDEVMAGACPVIASFGAKDRALRGAPAKLSAALEKAEVVHEVTTYPNAGHAFLNEGESGPRWLRPLLRASHSGPEPESAAQEWRPIEAFFAAHLSGGRTT